jgi:hypothetical protein
MRGPKEGVKERRELETKEKTRKEKERQRAYFRYL